MQKAKPGAANAAVGGKRGRSNSISGPSRAVPPAAEKITKKGALLTKRPKAVHAEDENALEMMPTSPGSVMSLGSSMSGSSGLPMSEAGSSSYESSSSSSSAYSSNGVMMQLSTGIGGVVPVPTKKEFELYAGKVKKIVSCTRPNADLSCIVCRMRAQGLLLSVALSCFAIIATHYCAVCLCR